MKKKLKIQELKIQSFITELDSSLAKTAKGGSDLPTGWICSVVVIGGMISTAYSVAATNQSWFPYNGSSNCTKITTTTTTTTLTVIYV